MQIVKPQICIIVSLAILLIYLFALICKYNSAENELNEASAPIYLGEDFPSSSPQEYAGSRLLGCRQAGKIKRKKKKKGKRKKKKQKQKGKAKAKGKRQKAKGDRHLILDSLVKNA